MLRALSMSDGVYGSIYAEPWGGRWIQYIPLCLRIYVSSAHHPFYSSGSAWAGWAHVPLVCNDTCFLILTAIWMRVNSPHHPFYFFGVRRVAGWAILLLVCGARASFAWLKNNKYCWQLRKMWIDELSLLPFPRQAVLEGVLVVC